MTQPDKWSEYWQQEGASGEVFVGKDGAPHPALAAFWQTQLPQPGARIIDLACGAGSVFAHVGDPRQYELHAADFSIDAISILRQRDPAILATVSSAAEPPYPDGSFDMVVSQFGVEYAGIDAFRTAGRLVRAAGKLAMLCHYENGTIDRKNRELLAGATVARDTNFIDKAAAMVEAAFSSSAQALDTAARSFAPSERALAAAVSRYRGGVHTHLYGGFRQLFERRAAYELKDITDWLEAMAVDLETNIVRLTAMCEAALSNEQIDHIGHDLRGEGFEVTTRPFHGSDRDVPVAWQLVAKKTGSAP